jgi:hypothetical protein
VKAAAEGGGGGGGGGEEEEKEEEEEQEEGAATEEGRAAAAAFAPADGLTTLKAQQYGLRKEELTAFAPLLSLVGLASPLLVARFLAGPRPLDVWLRGYVPRQLVGLLFVAAV